MKKIPAVAFTVAAIVLLAKPVFALSEKISQPNIYFPKGYSANRAAQILHVLRSEKLAFRSGLISYWEPEWSTTLVYGADTKALHGLLHDLSGIAGLRVKVSFSKNLDRESSSALPSGSWWVKFSHTSPDVVAVRINLAAPAIDLSKLELWTSPEP